MMSLMSITKLEEINRSYLPGTLRARHGARCTSNHYGRCGTITSPSSLGFPSRATSRPSIQPGAWKRGVKEGREGGARDGGVRKGRGAQACCGSSLGPVRFATPKHVRSTTASYARRAQRGFNLVNSPPLTMYWTACARYRTCAMRSNPDPKKQSTLKSVTLQRAVASGPSVGRFL